MTSQNIIPKVIHYVWLGDKPLPEIDRHYIEGWQKLNPDYKIKRWTEKDVDLDKYPIIKKALAEKRWALAADVIRMIAIYSDGGVYLDTDVELLQPLDDLLKYDGFAGWESNYWFTTAVFGAKKHSEWIAKILKRYEKVNCNKKITTNTFLKTVQSPSVYAKDIYGLKLDGKTRQYGNFKVFSREYFSPKHYMTGEDCSTNRTIAFHHYASTWHTRRERVKNDCTRIAYRMLGEKRFSYLEKRFNASLERKIRRELP